MRICENGKYRDATPEEEDAWNQAAQEQPEQTQTVEDQAVTFDRAMARTMTTISDADALTMPDILPTWKSYLDAGEQIPAGVCVMHNGQCYRQVQSVAVTPQEHQPPGGEGMLAVYRPIEREHAGTQADPIPWVYGMDEQYSITVTAAGYEEFTQQVTADSDQIVQATLTPTGT